MKNCDKPGRAGTSFKRSINLSPGQLQRGNFIESWDRALSSSGCDASQLQVKITETTLMENLPEARRVLNHLREQGMTVAIDDLGTGYSSLGYLKELPIDILKIDQRFVQESGTHSVTTKSPQPPSPWPTSSGYRS